MNFHHKNGKIKLSLSTKTTEISQSRFIQNVNAEDHIKSEILSDKIIGFLDIIYCRIL